MKADDMHVGMPMTTLPESNNAHDTAMCHQPASGRNTYVVDNHIKLTVNACQHGCKATTEQIQSATSAINKRLTAMTHSVCVIM